MAGVERGRVRLRGVSRSFRLVHERNLTLKETLLRRQRTRATQLWALRNLDLDVAPGEALGVIGQNGAGKSTLLKVIAEILPPQAGTVEVGGTVASMLELGAGFHPDFTGRENVYMNAAIHGLSEAEVDSRFEEIVEFSELSGFIDMPVKSYSSGMHMRLAFAVASHVNPDVMLLDEVLAVGDESFQRKCYGRMFAYRRRGGTLVFVSHDPASIERLCDRAILLIDGEIAADGLPHEVVAEYHRRLVEAEAGAIVGAQAVEAAPVEDDPQVWGTREVTIRAVRLVGPDGPGERFMSGDPLTIEIDVEADRTVETPNFGVAVHTVDGTLCYGTNTRLDSLPTIPIRGTATASFSVPALHLHEGRFSLTVAVTSHDERTVFHWLDRWIEFSVFQRGSGLGPVDITGHWSLRAARPGADVGSAQEAAQTAGST
jgi:ABC-type polysaccharide/polyol phosphate transport system ATPase subunit